MRITNTSEAPQGVWTASGLVYIQPGAARDIEPGEELLYDYGVGYRKKLGL